MNPDNSPSVFSLSATPTPGRREHRETVWQFLERSTEPVAGETRNHWDEWLSRMPADARARLVTRLKDRHDELVRAALAELVTFVLLNSLYQGAVEVEPETGTGSRTDFAIGAPPRTHFEVYRKAPSQNLVSIPPVGVYRQEVEARAAEQQADIFEVDAQRGLEVFELAGRHRHHGQRREVWHGALDETSRLVVGQLRFTHGQEVYVADETVLIVTEQRLAARK